MVLGTTLGVLTQAQFSEVETSWTSYSGGPERKGALISELRGFLGYGGIIHNFKNYVLRQDPVYLDETRLQLERFQQVVSAFEGLQLSETERGAIAVISRTVAGYETNLAIAEQGAQDGWPVSRTDTLVRIDDGPAVQALARLEAEWRALQDLSTARLFAAVTEGRNLIWIGYWSILALFCTAMAIGVLLYLLVRDLQSELRQRQRLQQSQARLATIVEQSPATIILTDTDARIQYVNRKFKALTGWDDAEIIGQTPAFLQSGATAPGDYAEVRARLEAGAPWHGIFRNLRKDGTSYWAETTILPLRDAEGAVQNYVGIGEDITEARKARDQVVRAQKLEAVGQLAGGVAHDFNNILTTIVGASHLAAMDAPEGSDLANEIDQIGIAARRAQHLVRELLTFARREPAVPQPVVLADVVDEVVHLLRASIPPTTTITLTPPETPLAVMGDATHLHQIVMNLCRNAAEAMSGAPGTITIRIATTQTPDGGRDAPDGWVRLDVSDDGPGMSAQTLAHLFEPFFTTKPLGKGSGLGLAVVHGLVEDMGGHIDVDSTLGVGSTFSVILPATTADQRETGQTEDPLPRGTERILLVDDEAEVASTFRRQLMRLGYQVDAFKAPGLALEHFRRRPGDYDLVITDMVMPEMNGQELASAIRIERMDMPVIICSGYRPEGVVLEGDAPLLLHKPIDPVVFARHVRAAIDQPS